MICLQYLGYDTAMITREIFTSYNNPLTEIISDSCGKESYRIDAEKNEIANLTIGNSASVYVLVTHLRN